ncbi:MAG: sugar phosphate isomerase/epimerase [Pirellulaceae bacterium]|nr:sugar phosphate isomerase/epimerase [Pirellulaceae bacterium]
MQSPITRREFVRQATLATGVLAGTASGASWARADDRKFDPPYAICNETFGDMPFDRAFGLAAECGYKGLEIAPFTVANDVNEVSAERRRTIRRQAEQAGLQVVGLHWLLARTQGIHLTSPDAEVRRRTADFLGALAEFCAELGGDLLVFGSPQQRNLMPDVTREQGLEYAADVVAACLPRLERVNVRLAFEPLAAGTTNFLRTAAETLELVRRIDSPRCRMILDCLAMSSEPTPIPQLVRQYHEHVVHFHANDPNRQGPGFGELDFVPIFQALRDVNFAGWVSVEVFDYKPGAERLARESIAYMRKCVEQTTG